MPTRARAHGCWLTPFFSSSFCLYVAPKAEHVQHEPGAAPQDLEHTKNASAESAIHFRHQFDPPARLKRAYSACLGGDLNSWGDAPGSDETAALALKQTLLVQG